MRPWHDAGIAGGGAGQAGWPGDTEALGGEGQHRHQGGGGPHRAAPLQVIGPSLQSIVGGCLTLVYFMLR